MSLPLTPFERWLSGTNQNSIPANNNSLRAEIFATDGIADDVDAQPGSPSDGDWYIMTATPSGSQWGGFAPDSVAIFYEGTWYEFVPKEGNQVTVAGTIVIYSGSSGWTPVSVVGSATWGGISGTLSDQTDLQAALDGKATNRATVTSVSSSSGVVTLNYALGDYFKLALTENVTSWSITNPPGSGQGFTLMVEITQDSTPRTVAKPGTTAGGAALGVSTGSGDIDVLAISSFDNGTTLRSTIAKDFS